MIAWRLRHGAEIAHAWADEKVRSMCGRVAFVLSDEVDLVAGHREGAQPPKDLPRGRPCVDCWRMVWLGAGNDGAT